MECEDSMSFLLYGIGCNTVITGYTRSGMLGLALLDLYMSLVKHVEIIVWIRYSFRRAYSRMLLEMFAAESQSLSNIIYVEILSKIKKDV